MHLAKTEWDLLAILVRSPGKLVSQRQLLQDVWGPTYLNETHYLRQYMAQLRKKLEPDPTRPAISSPSPAWAIASCPDRQHAHWPRVSSMGTRVWARGLRTQHPSDCSEVESSGFLGGAFGGAGTGVTDEHVGTGPAGDGHEARLGTAGSQPAMRRSVPEPVWPEALDPSARLGVTAGA